VDLLFYERGLQKANAKQDTSDDPNERYKQQVEYLVA
jgi:hypothetical protein